MKKYLTTGFLISFCFSLSMVSATSIAVPVTTSIVGDEAPDQESEGCTDLSYNLTYKKSKDSNTNGEVSDLQYFLQDQGLLTAEPNGMFGPSTLRAVKYFQKKNGFITSGYVGPMTRAKIKEISCNQSGENVSTNTNNEINGKKVCKGAGTRSEGWYDSATGELIKYDNCSDSATSPVACTMEYRACADGSKMPRDANCKWREDKCSNICNSEQYRDQNGKCKDITKTCPDGRVVAGMVSCELSLEICNSEQHRDSNGKCQNLRKTCPDGKIVDVMVQCPTEVVPYNPVADRAPTVNISSGGSNYLVLGSENKIGEFTVTANANGKIGIYETSFTVSSTGITNLELISPRFAEGNTTIPGLSASVSGSNIVITYNHVYEIPAGTSKTFSLFATVLGNTQSGVAQRISSTLTSPSSFKWMDFVGSSMQYDGKLIYNFPTNSFVLTSPGVSVTPTSNSSVSTIKSTLPTVLGASTMCTDISRNLHRGAESLSVNTLQKFLHNKGFLSEDPTGFYGDKTIEAVKDYQASKGLVPTGMVYEVTRQAVRDETCQQ